MVEAAGIEPASEEADTQASTCVASGEFSRYRLPETEAVAAPDSTGIRRFLRRFLCRSLAPAVASSLVPSGKGPRPCDTDGREEEQNHANINTCIASRRTRGHACIRHHRRTARL